jgi:hypothetical protein
MPDEGRAIIFVFGILIFFIALSVYFGDSCAAACRRTSFLTQFPRSARDVIPGVISPFDSMTPRSTHLHNVMGTRIISL